MEARPDQARLQAASKIEDYLEPDLLALVAGLMPHPPSDLLGLDAPARAHALRLFVVFFGRSAFLRDDDGRTAHNRALDENRRFETQVTDDLSRRVFDEVFPQLATALDAAARGSAPQHAHTNLADLREATLTYLYRLLFVLYAEDRDLLPSRAADYKQYSLGHVREAVAMRLDASEGLSATRTHYDSALRELWRQIDNGDPEIGVPPYNSKLFAPDRSLLHERVRVPDSALAPLIDALSRRDLIMGSAPSDSASAIATFPCGTWVQFTSNCSNTILAGIPLEGSSRRRLRSRSRPAGRTTRRTTSCSSSCAARSARSSRSGEATLRRRRAAAFGPPAQFRTPC